MQKIKSLFISYIHIGNKNSQCDKLLSVLKEYEFENLFIIGDFIDMTSLKKKFYWNENFSTVIQKILKLSRHKVNVVLLIGNHDFYLRSLIQEQNINLGNILICDEYIYDSIKGEKIYLVHGDCFDGFVATHKILYLIGDFGYELSMRINKIYNKIRKMFGLNYWSFSAYLKRKVKNIIKFLTEYKKASMILVKEKECDSLLMGHTHSPEIIQGEYYNTGDFVESCSYIIEDLEGNLELRFITEHI
jgi:UDP-2,3-diacylglucosamine pyrophosphatase LpxH